MVSPVQCDYGRLTFSSEACVELIELTVVTYLEQIRSLARVDVEACATALED